MRRVVAALTAPLLLAGCGHWLMGSVDWWLLLSLLLGSVPGILIASHLAHKIPERVLLPALAVVLVVVDA